jgi:hypothetical protein
MAGFIFQLEEKIVLYCLAGIEEDIEKIKPRVEGVLGFFM